MQARAPLNILVQFHISKMIHSIHSKMNTAILLIHCLFISAYGWQQHFYHTHLLILQFCLLEFVMH